MAYFHFPAFLNGFCSLENQVDPHEIMSFWKKRHQIYTWRFNQSISQQKQTQRFDWRSCNSWQEEFVKMFSLCLNGISLHWRSKHLEGVFWLPLLITFLFTTLPLVFHQPRWKTPHTEQRVFRVFLGLEWPWESAVNVWAALRYEVVLMVSTAPVGQQGRQKLQQDADVCVNEESASVSRALHEHCLLMWSRWMITDVCVCSSLPPILLCVCVCLLPI